MIRASAARPARTISPAAPAAEAPSVKKEPTPRPGEIHPRLLRGSELPALRALLRAFRALEGAIGEARAARVLDEAPLHGELEYQTGMVSPWTRGDIGSYYGQLIDGNHRAAAALLLGEPTVPVYVGEMTRENVRKKDWV